MASTMNIDEMAEAIDALRDRLDRMVARAESGEQWADICGLEEELVALERDYDNALQDNSQLGVGA